MRHFIRLAVLAMWVGCVPAFAQESPPQSLVAGCESGDSQDCANLGGFYSTIGGDRFKARAAYEKGCKLNSLTACAGLYEYLSLGIGGPPDRVRAKTLEPRVCKTGIVSLDVHLEVKGLCKN